MPHTGFLLEDICNGRDINARQGHIAGGMHMVASGRKPPTAIWLLSSLSILGGPDSWLLVANGRVVRFRRSVRASRWHFRRGSAKKEEREIHWRYGLVSARVERTTCGRKKGKKKEKEKKKEAISSRSFSAPPLREPPNPGAGNGSDFLRLRIFYHRNGLDYLSAFNGAKRELPNIRA